MCGSGGKLISGWKWYSNEYMSRENRQLASGCDLGAFCSCDKKVGRVPEREGRDDEQSSGQLRQEAA